MEKGGGGRLGSIDESIEGLRGREGGRTGCRPRQTPPRRKDRRSWYLKTHRRERQLCLGSGPPWSSLRTGRHDRCLRCQRGCDWKRRPRKRRRRLRRRRRRGARPRWSQSVSWVVLPFSQLHYQDESSGSSCRRPLYHPEVQFPGNIFGW